MKTITDHVADYLRLRRGLGFKLRVHGYLLQDFARFCQQEGVVHITTEVALRWAVLPDNIQPPQRGVRLGMVRGLCRYLATIDPATEIPPQRLLSARKRRHVPGFYQDDQIVALIQATAGIDRSNPLKCATYATLFGLLAVTEMRVGEAISMDCRDVDLDQSLLALSATKGARHRLVPLHPSTAQALTRYVELRSHWYPLQPAASFFVGDGGSRLCYSTVNRWFLILARRIGLREQAPARGIRLHDLRHYFATRTLLDWYRNDIDVSAHLPDLATYLGHVHVSDTYWYLSATPELLELASRRWQSSKGGPL